MKAVTEAQFQKSQPAKVSTTELIRQFVEPQDVAETTKTTYRSTLTHFAVWFDEKKPIEQATEQDASEYKAHLLSSGKTSEIASNHARTVERFVKWLNRQHIVIDPEFQSLIRPLSPQEYQLLEESIKVEGCRDPLVLWEGKNILLDGNNRHNICLKHGIPFQTTTREFESRAEAKKWIIENQLGRRNINAYTRAVMALQLKEVLEEEAKQRQKAGKVVPNWVQGGRTKDKLAATAGVGRGTLERVEKIEAEAPEGLKELLIRKDVSVYDAYQAVKAMEGKDQTLWTAILERVESGEADTVTKAVEAELASHEVPEPKSQSELTEAETQDEPISYAETEALAKVETEAQDLEQMQPELSPKPGPVETDEKQTDSGHTGNVSIEDEDAQIDLPIFEDEIAEKTDQDVDLHASVDVDPTAASGGVAEDKESEDKKWQATIYWSDKIYNLTLKVFGARNPTEVFVGVKVSTNDIEKLKTVETFVTMAIQQLQIEEIDDVF